MCHFPVYPVHQVNAFLVVHGHAGGLDDSGVRSGQPRPGYREQCQRNSGDLGNGAECPLLQFFGFFRGIGEILLDRGFCGIDSGPDTSQAYSNLLILPCRIPGKAIAREGMADYIKFLYKTVRKYFGEAVVVTQELDDIVSSPIIKDTIINNADCKILLDQRKYSTTVPVRLPVL